MPKLKHPDSKHAIEVSKEQVPLYLSQGWQPAASGAANKTPAPSSKGGK